MFVLKYFFRMYDIFVKKTFSSEEKLQLISVYAYLNLLVQKLPILFKKKIDWDFAQRNKVPAAVLQTHCPNFQTLMNFQKNDSDRLFEISLRHPDLKI